MKVYFYGHILIFRGFGKVSELRKSTPTAISVPPIGTKLVQDWYKTSKPLLPVLNPYSFTLMRMALDICSCFLTDLL